MFFSSLLFVTLKSFMNIIRILLQNGFDEGSLVYYENENGFGLYCKNGLDIEKLEKASKKCKDYSSLL